MTGADPIYEEDFHGIVELMLSHSSIEYESEKRLSGCDYVIDIYLPETDTAIELKTIDDHRKGVGQVHSYLQEHDNGVLLVPYQYANERVWQMCSDLEIEYVLMKNESFNYRLVSAFFDTFQQQFIDAAHVEIGPTTQQAKMGVQYE